MQEFGSMSYVCEANTEAGTESHRIVLPDGRAPQAW